MTRMSEALSVLRNEMGNQIEKVPSYPGNLTSGSSHLKDLINKFKVSKKGHISNRETFEIMGKGGTSRPYVLLEGVVNNEVTIIFPKKYTVAASSPDLLCRNQKYPEHGISINKIVADGYSCLVDTKHCMNLGLDMEPGFENDTLQVIYKNPLLNRQVKHLLVKFEED
jgi:hypothetical protein